MKRFTLMFGLAASLALTGCHSGTKTASAGAVEDEAQCTAVKAGTVSSVNTLCAIMPSNPVDPAVKCSDFNGQKIGFCCAGCIGKWEALTPAQKTEKLAKAQTMATAK